MDVIGADHNGNCVHVLQERSLGSFNTLVVLANDPRRIYRHPVKNERTSHH